MKKTTIALMILLSANKEISNMMFPKLVHKTAFHNLYMQNLKDKQKIFMNNENHNQLVNATNRLANVIRGGVLRTSIISSTLAFLTLSVISSKSLAGISRTIIITNDNSLPISWLRIRVVNTKEKWYQLMSITQYLEEGHTKTFKVSTDQCKYTLVAQYINSTMDVSVLNLCDGEETTPIKITYTGTGGTYDVSGRYIGDNPDCQPIPSWVSGIRTTVRPCD